MYLVMLQMCHQSNFFVLPVGTVLSKRRKRAVEDEQKTTNDLEEKTVKSKPMTNPTNSVEIHIENATAVFNAEGTVIIKLVC